MITIRPSLISTVLSSKFDEAMLVSADGQGQLHGRPMRIVDRPQDGQDSLWFVSARDAGKIAEIHGEPRVVILADGGRFVSISGDARVVVDPAKVADMWQESWKLWFPEGPAGGNVALIQVQPLRAEYWDQSLPNGIRFAIQATKAWLRNEKIAEPDGPEQHGKVRLS